MSNNKHQKYGIFTAASLVVGIVIGSGIFFKADDILVATNGNVWVGVLAFLIVGIGVLFGALAVSQYAQNAPNSEGGIVAYSLLAFGEKFSFITGWVMMSSYFPSLIIVLAYVASGYALQFLGIESSSFAVWGLTLFFLVFSFLTNLLHSKLTGNVQVITTIAKLLPLFVIGLVGLFYVPELQNTTSFGASMSEGNFFLALLAIAFTFDGWIIATSISGEVKDAQKNLPKALIYGCLGIIIIYIIYFLGISALVGPDQIMQLGDEHVAYAAEKIIGPVGSRLVTFFLVISVYGGLNGMVLAYLRFPRAMVKNGVFKDVFNISKVHPKYDLSINGALFTIPFLVFFYIFTYITFNVSWFVDRAFDSSSIGIVSVYVIYILLYIGVIKYIKSGQTKKIYYVYIVIASLIGLLIVVGSMLPQPGQLISNGTLYLLIVAAFFLIAKPFMKVNK